MADEEFKVVELNDHFYRDGFGKVIVIAIGLFVAISLLVGLAIYIHITKPVPVSFSMLEDFRVQPDINLDQPYLSTSDMLQWVTNTVPSLFVLDFNHYNNQLKAEQHFFTPNGWKIFSNQLNIYANYNTVQSNRLFINGRITGAPYVVTEGLISGRYAWWVQLPITLSFAGYIPQPDKPLTLQILVVRISTLEDLNGVSIDNVIVVNGQSDKLSTSQAGNG